MPRLHAAFIALSLVLLVAARSPMAAAAADQQLLPVPPQAQASIIDRYDLNGNGTIEKNEVIAAINDYLFNGTVTKNDVITLINFYLFGQTTQPHLRHIEEKRYILELINAEREKAGLTPVVLGSNSAAQIHAEAALRGCFSSHWGLDGLKPYMRYTLAGGYQPNGENGLGRDYCIGPDDGYAPNQGIREEIAQGMRIWMESPGHRRNILTPQHKKVNIGLAWDSHNVAFYQHFEGDYTGYTRPPVISGRTLSLAGTTRNGPRFHREQDLGVSVYFDRPPALLTRGQLSRTGCYDNGLQVASLRQPLPDNHYYANDEYTRTARFCPDPYDVPPDTPPPSGPSGDQEPPLTREEREITIPWVTADSWTASGEEFAVSADLGPVLDEHGNGVYTILVWARQMIISEYSIFHGFTPPETYYGR